ncbi:MAG: hypothetical protein J2P38_08945, partial [Candidatus Dormibacteraeota bacterium]|nr:hypothetical protein [Candidatus Dormibacteraeota bacterium]
HDTGALARLSGAGVHTPALAGLSRAWVVSVQPVSATAAVAQVDLIQDGGPGRAHSHVATEELHLQVVGPDDAVQVESVSVSRFTGLTAGPHIVHVGLDASAHLATVTYNCDMDPGSVAGSNRATAPDGSSVPVTTTYDATTKTVTVHFPRSMTGPVHLSVTRGLRDIHDRHLAVPFHTTVTLAG